MIEDILIGLFSVLLYGSGLLVWPICALLWRKSHRRAKALRWAFFCEAVCQAIVIGLFLFSTGIVEHQYQWLMLSIIINIVFTPVALGSALYDHAKQIPAA